MSTNSGRRGVLWLGIVVAVLAVGAVVAALLLSDPGGGEAAVDAGEGPVASRPAEETSGACTVDPDKDYTATIATDKGDIVIDLYADVAPKTVANFVKLACEGFYNGLTFHRVDPGFVIQGGDPAGNGTGGPGYDLDAEISDTKHLTGTVAMARKGDQVNPQRRSSGSQFYICLAPAPFLDGQYTIFGQVSEGMDVVQSIQPGDVMREVSISER